MSQWWLQATQTPTRIVGLDPAQSFGWAWFDVKTGPRIDQSGTWKLKVGSSVKASPGGYKFSQAYKLITGLISPDGQTVIYYEKAARHVGTAAAHAAGGYYAMIQAVGYDNCVHTHAVSVGSVKKFATGKGNADKAMMIETANEEWGVLSGAQAAGSHIAHNEDDRADALWVAAYGLKSLRGS